MTSFESSLPFVSFSLINCNGFFFGQFCEFLVGQKIPEHMNNGMGLSKPMVDSSTNNSSGSSSSNRSNGATIAIVVMSLVLVCSVGVALVSYFLLQQRRRNNKEDQPSHATTTAAPAADVSGPLSPRVVSSPEYALEADGSVLQNAVKAGLDDSGDLPPVDPTFDITESESADDDDCGDII